ncbi:MAG: hypothetical protein LBK73_03345 [Treponema sp.]|jgi:hypothetical protein|nr:hypothetical protein [Treponema sp.]
MAFPKGFVQAYASMKEKADNIDRTLQRQGFALRNGASGKTTDRAESVFFARETEFNEFSPP